VTRNTCNDSFLHDVFFFLILFLFDDNDDKKVNLHTILYVEKSEIEKDISITIIHSLVQLVELA
jgi:hypothetical protein